ncbi:unnamed protein product [Adineta ricciae]|uniref:RNA-dependent RNA polymerase n=1 Tax=Adineta ricciae TaxID=249248 RepID=A0A813XHH2_ADIRI|nr:unnamed protein product [Adineta ricciae]CAF0950321.1 unnamed protein product [Adineta ricciae]
MDAKIESTPTFQLSIIVDPAASSLNYKALYSHISVQPPDNRDHHYWHFGGLRSYTIPFYSKDDDEAINNVMTKLKQLQTQFPPYWISLKQCHQQTSSLLAPCETIKKNVKLGKFYTNDTYQIQFTAGSLVQLNQYIYDPVTEIRDGWCLVFYHDRIDLDYGSKENKLRKTFKAELMDRCAVIMDGSDTLTLFLNVTGNSVDYKSVIDDNKLDQDSALQKPTSTYRRTADREAQPFYSTIRLVISLSNTTDRKEDDHQVQNQYIQKCRQNFIEFFQRNRIHVCFGLINSMSSMKNYASMIAKFMNDESMSFIKQYCWQMLFSIGYRFQQRLVDTFIQHMNSIKDDDDFYQTSLHLWRRSSEYYFINLLTELYRYQKKSADVAALSHQMNRHHHTDKKTETEQIPQHWSIHTPPPNYAYVPSVTLTPTTICVKPLKLVKTNRVLREPQFGGNLMFALVDVKDENGKIDLFPHDYRALRWKTEMLLESGFDLGRRGRIYRYLHHSQSQLKDKQFWFYYHDKKTNFSFEQAFAWMGDFQEETIVAKHSARIAQCFTSAEATIPIPSEKVEYIDDVHTKDSKYNFTDGVGTMSTAVRDLINSHRKFSAMQIRYGGCKGVISVNPDLDGADHQLRIRKSMRKFKCDHDILELCRISKPRPLYLNRQIIVLLSHRLIDDRTFLLLQNKHQQFLSESLVYPEKALELLSEKLNRKLFPSPALIDEAHLNLIAEPFFHQLLITIGKFELAQMKERTRLKLPKNSARNMIGIVDEYRILEYGQVFVQYTELNSDYKNNESKTEKTVILEQSVVVTKNPCHHPGDIRVFSAVNVPQLQHLKDVIVFPQRGERPHPNEISGSDLDGDEYAVIWDPEFIPKTPNATPYEYDSHVPMKRVVDRPVNRSDIQRTVLDISEQSCAGKLCSLHLAYMDRHGVGHKKTLAIAGHISEELDAPKTGQHPLSPEQISELQAELGNERPDYFDKPYYKSYPSSHILGQLFRSCLRFEPNWIKVQTPPTTVCASRIDPLLVHDRHQEYTPAAEELARIYRESIMDIMYVYRFSSDVDIFCRFDSSSSQYHTPLSKQQTESACLVADSAQIELRQLVHRIRRLFFEELRSSNKSTFHRCHPTCDQCLDNQMAKASALYFFCYTDTRHARPMLSLPWLFASLLLKTRIVNIRKQTKLLSAALVAPMLEIQPHRSIGQSLRCAVMYFIEKKIPCHFDHTYSSQTPTNVTVSIGPKSLSKRLLRKPNLPFIDYLVIEMLQHYVQNSLSAKASDVKSANPTLVDAVWQHILTRFVLDKCSPWIISRATTAIFIEDLPFWSDEQASTALKRLIDISIQCAYDARKSEDTIQPRDYAHANEYLVSALQKMAATGCLFST